MWEYIFALMKAALKLLELNLMIMFSSMTRDDPEEHLKLQ